MSLTTTGVEEAFSEYHLRLISGKEVTMQLAERGYLLEEIEDLNKLVADLKALRIATPLHVLYTDLPEEDRFKQL